MSAQNVTARRGAVIAGAAGTVLLVFVAAFDNQWTQNWREARYGGTGGDGNSWISLPIKELDTLAWRATPYTGEATQVFVGNLVATILAIVLTAALVLLVCRGVGGERGRWPLFLGTWLATGLGTGLGLIVGILIAGNKFSSLDKGTTYYTEFGAGFEFAAFIGWLVGFTAVLAYGSTPGMDDLAVAAEYTPPSGYDYGSATPAAYSYTPTSPYEQNPSGYGSGTGSDGTPTHVVQPPEQEPPYGGGGGGYGGGSYGGSSYGGNSYTGGSSY
jgi:hypothetical protein